MNKNILLVCLWALTIITGCGSHQEHHVSLMKLPVTTSIVKDTMTVRHYVAQIHAARHIELRALEKGYIENIYVDEGQFIQQGQLMFQIMPRLHQAELKRAKAEAEFAQIEYENTKRLAESNVVAPNELALAKAKFDQAKAALSLAQVHLDFTQVRAPFDGIMDHFQVREGSLVEEGELLTTLSDNHEMWVYFNVPEAEYLNYASKVSADSVMEVSLKLANNQLFEYYGKVTAIEADFNPETGNIAFRATFPNPKGLLRHGETGNILVNRPLKGAQIIPQKATFEILDKKYVYVVGADHKVHARPIEVGAELPHLYEVISGLRASELILLEGLRKVSDGDEIEPDFRSPEELLGHLDLYAE